MRYLIGIDSGGSKTRGILETCHGETVLSQYQAATGSTNHHACGADAAVSELNALIGQLCGQAGITAGQITSICLASAGIDSPMDREFFTRCFDQLGCGGTRILCSDGIAALVGANGGLNGAIVISGTGSIAYGVGSGGLFSVGGWGYKVDDPGSGYAIAVGGLRAVFEAHDGRGENTQITGALLEQLNLGSVHELLDYVYASDCTPARIAQLSHCVLELAHTDPVARRIWLHAVDELLRLVRVLARRMPQDGFRLGLCGGVLENEKYFREELIGRITQECPNASPHLPIHSAAEGALIIMKNREGLSGGNHGLRGHVFVDDSDTAGRG